MVNDDTLLAEALDDPASAERLLKEHPELSESFCALTAEARLLHHALAPTKDDVFVRRVMSEIVPVTRTEPPRRPSGRRRPVSQRRPSVSRFSLRPWFLAAAAVVTCVVLVVTHAPPPPPIIAWLDTVKGTVTVADKTVQVGAGLPQGRQLSVEEGSEATLRFADGSLMQVGGGARLSVIESQEGVRTHLLRGRVLATVAPQRRDYHFSVQSPQMLVQVVGTVFSIKSANEVSYLSVREGKVQAERLKDRLTVMVGAGQSVTAAEGQPFVPSSDAAPVVDKNLKGFTLCDARSGNPLPGGSPLVDGAIINIRSLPDHPISLRADADNTVDAVVFHCDGPDGHVQRSEELAPFYLTGDLGGQISPWMPVAGPYRITAIPHCRDGHTGQPLSVSFTVVR